MSGMSASHCWHSNFYAIKIYPLLPNPQPFLERIFQHLAADRIAVEEYELDHLCYRVETMEAYVAYKKILASQGELLTESIIGGRPIATYKLKEPFVFQSRKIELLELPAPKLGRFYPVGYEHVEFVIDKSLEAFQRQYAHLDFDTKGKDKKINPDLRLVYETGSVKFHLYNLEYVIKYLD